MASDSPAYSFNVSTEGNPQVLADRSLARYSSTYEKFMKWHKTQNTNSFTEELLLEYFGEMAKTFAPTTLFAMYSMLKCMLNSKHNVNIGSYSQLLTFLKKSREGFISNTLPRLFSADEVNKFLVEAPDWEYLAIKAVTVFALNVTSGSEMLTNIKMEYITDYGNEILVRIPDPTTKETKVSVISGGMVHFVRNYIRLRPKPTPTDRFFIQYRDGKCTIQHIGKHTIAKMPQKIAEFLGWPESEILNGLSFRRMSSAILANAKKKPGSTAFEGRFQTTTAVTGRIEAAQEYACTKNVNGHDRQTSPVTQNNVSTVRIKLENEQEFEAAEYILSDINRYSHSHQDIVIKTENVSVQESADSRSDDHRHSHHENISAVNRIIPEQQPHQHGLLINSFPSETNPNKRIKYSGDDEVATKGIESCRNNSLCQRTIKAQAEEIARLKQLIERQNLKIDSLEALLLDNLREKFDVSWKIWQ